MPVLHPRNLPAGALGVVALYLMWLAPDRIYGIDSGALCSNIEGQIAGSVAFSANLKFFRYEQGDDDAWDLVNWGDAGYLVIRRGLPYDTIWGVGQDVEVYKAQFGEPVVASSAANTLTTFEVSLFVEDAEQKATVGASS